MNLTLFDILSLKFPDANFMKDILLSDEGKGAFISGWHLESPMPSSEDIERWEKELDFPYRLKQAIESRIYPSIPEQMDMMYHDKVDGTTTWIDAIKSVKDAHPKPES